VTVVALRVADRIRQEPRPLAGVTKAAHNYQVWRTLLIRSPLTPSRSG
jgi:hypothetical protein